MAQIGDLGRDQALLRVGFICGFVGGLLGVALDFDHILALWWKRLPITWYNLARESGRPLHLPATMALGIILLTFGALRFGWVALEE